MGKTLYVARVGLTAGLGPLEDLFTTVADIQSQRLESFPESSVQPFGVFEMSTEQGACDCWERFNGYELDGQRLSIARELPKKPSPLKRKGQVKHGRA